MGGQWDNWVALAAGIVVGLSWVWHGLFGLGMVVLFLLGLATVLTAVLSLTRPGMLSSEAVLIGIGVLLVLTPWLFGFTGNLAAAWTAWVAGVVIAVTGAVGLVRSWRSHGTQGAARPFGVGDAFADDARPHLSRTVPGVHLACRG